MATLTLTAELTPEALGELVTSISEDELARYEHVFAEERRRRLVPGNEEEVDLIEAINCPIPHAERYAELSPKWQAGVLTAEERAEWMAMIEDREADNVEKLAAVIRLAELRGVPFDPLWRQLMGPVPRAVYVAG